jgi:hypothetical protein
MTSARANLAAALAAGAVLGAAATAWLTSGRPLAAAQTEPAENPAVATMRADVETLKGKAPDQAHAMQDVGYHFSNLWFAGQHEHWDLATFYLAETRSHLRWAVRIIPVRKDNAGAEINLADILQAMENVPLKRLEEAIAAKDSEAFGKAYRFSMENCYSCHKASDKPFIRPQIPMQPETSIINFDPAAEWPR